MQITTIGQAVCALQRGEAVIFPTETVYGLGISVSAAAGPDVLYNLKERDRGKPISWLVGSVSDLDRYGTNLSGIARKLAKAYWPGPLTLVVHASSAVPVAFQSNAGTIGLRMPNSATALALIRAAGCPLATTSANLSGHEATCSFETLDQELATRVGILVADEADYDKSGVASTVVDCTQDPPVILREGSVTLSDIQALA